MTYVEFFDKNVAENICTCLSQMPKRVVLIGDKYEQLVKHASRYREVFFKRGFDVEFVCRTVNKNNIKSILEALIDIVDSYDKCVFDVTGGDDLHLVAMGMVWQLKRDKNIQIHRFNFQNNTIIDCDTDGNNVVSVHPYLNVDENIKVHGGDIIYDTVKPGGTHIWTVDDMLVSDVNAVWNICKETPSVWNNYANMLGVAEKYKENKDDALKTVTSINRIVSAIGKNQNVSFSSKGHIISKLKAAGLILEFSKNQGKLTVVYKNHNVKQFLTKAGLALEMKTYILASTIKDEDGQNIYNDSMTGVCIDWDGKIHSERGMYDTENEVDVIIMKGMIPVFISCKNGQFEMDELYKLNSVAEKFGGKYAKKVLIANSLNSKSDFTKHLIQRANDMGIRIVANMQQMSESELNRIFKSFWCN